MAGTSKKVILASTSPYRRSLLKRLNIEFESAAPLIDEDEYKENFKNPNELAKELAYLKAKSIQNYHKDSIIIGGDQVVSFNNKIFGKPGNELNAFEQLTKFSGNTHELITCVCVLYKEKRIDINDNTLLKMKELSAPKIKEYIKLDRPFDCAGSYKLERHGIILFEKIDSEDFTAIQGIPLIKLSNVLDQLLD